MNYYLYGVMYLLSIFIVSYFYSQILITLLGIEILILRVLIIISYLFYINNILLLLLYFLVFVVCEGVLGLTLLVILIRSLGNDNLSQLNLLLW